MLECHNENKHAKLYSDRCAQCALEKIDRESSEKFTFQTSLHSFVNACPHFESSLLNWMIKTYQLLGVTECTEVREMCKSLNKRCPILGHDQIGRLLKDKYHVAHQKMIFILKGKTLCLLLMLGPLLLKLAMLLVLYILSTEIPGCFTAWS
jgi:hypothetical protein